MKKKPERIDREQMFRILGEPEPFVMGPTVPVESLGFSDWPSGKPAWRLIKRDKTWLWISDGLSKDFSSEDDCVTNGDAVAGMGLEFFVESLEAPPQAVVWTMSLLVQVCDIAVNNPSLLEILDEEGVISLELSITGVPDEYRASDGLGGVILGILHPEIPEALELENGRVWLISIKLLTGLELEQIREGGTLARRNLVDRFCGCGEYHLSTVKNATVKLKRGETES